MDKQREHPKSEKREVGEAGMDKDHQHAAIAYTTPKNDTSPRLTL